jgi:hypothetical protein
MDTIIQLINGVGFPIAVSIALFYQNTKQDERYQELTKDLQEVINTNTKTLSELNANLTNVNKKGGVTNG